MHSYGAMSLIHTEPSDMDHTVLPANYTMPAFTPQPQNITALWLVLIYRPTEGRTLSGPGWLVTYRNKVPPPGVEPGHGHPSQCSVSLDESSP